MRRFAPALLVLALLGGVALAPHRPVEAQDQALAPWVPAVMDGAQRFCTAWSAGDGPAVQATVTPQLWTRLAPRFQGGSPGSLGRAEVLKSGNLVKPDCAYWNVLCCHPDGVEDVMTLTFKRVNGEWKVAGGPCGGTPN